LDNVMPQACEETRRHSVNILVEQKPHAGTAVRWMSSADTSAIA